MYTFQRIYFSAALTSIAGYQGDDNDEHAEHYQRFLAAAAVRVSANAAAAGSAGVAGAAPAGGEWIASSSGGGAGAAAWPEPGAVCAEFWWVRGRQLSLLPLPLPSNFPCGSLL